MSGPYRAYPGNGGHLNPDSQGNQPVSFKTDINRKKTKKWVSAKSVSYDGDDWGDEDDEEEEEEEEAPPPLPTSRFQTNQPLSSTGAHPAQNTSTPTNVQSPTGPESLSNDTPAFVRPADIYKRMQEERAKEGQPSESSSAGPIPPTGPPHEAQLRQGNNTGPSTSPLVIPELKRLSGFGSDFMSGTNLSEQPPQPAQPAQPSQINNTQPQTQSLPLHHNPSLGFNSVVHQAFDVPETPTSSNDNFSRSNSDSTSVISPIISHGNLESAKTPTIAEDYAGEVSAQEPPANFKPGHRRDMSLPSPGNGPDRVPVISNGEHGQQAEVVSPSHPVDNLAPSADDGERSPPGSEGTASGEATPKPAPEPRQYIENPSLHAAPVESQAGSQNKEFQSPIPTPLHISQDQARDIPQINPSMSAETSPQDMESDRLRKEIMRSLSPDPTSVEDPSQTGDESSYFPQEYDGYLNDHKGIPITSPLQPKTATSPAGATEPLSLTINPAVVAESAANQPEASSAMSQPRSGLKKRFSWEASDSSDEEDVLEQPEQPTSIPSVHSASIAEDPSISKAAMGASSSSFSNDAVRDHTGDAPDERGLPRYSTIANESIQRPEDMAPEVVEPTATSSLAPLQEVDPSVLPPSPSVDSPALSAVHREATQPAGTEASLPSFRKIMEIPSGIEKIRVFKDTREQFARIDNGLEDWIRRSSESLPEHADLIRANGRLPGGPPTGVLPPKNKFPKLSSLGNLSLPSSHEGSSQLGYSPSHVRRSSGSPLTGVMNRQNVEAKGKDLLHSAGVFGGKAGGAARGLFAKGKSKLRGGADKGKSSIFTGRRRSTQLSIDNLSSDLDLASVKPNPPASPSASSRYSLQPVPRIPSFKFSENRSFTSPLADETQDLPKPRAMSLDWGKQLKSLPEEISPISRNGSNSSLRRAMMQFNLNENANNVHDSGDLCSAYSQPSPQGTSFSILDKYSQKGVQSTERDFLPGEDSRLSGVGATDSLHTQLTVPDAATGTSLSAVSSLSHDINQKFIPAGSDIVSARSLSPLHGETSKRFPDDTNNAVPTAKTRGTSLEAPREPKPARDSFPSRTHHISRFYKSDSTNGPGSGATLPVSNPNLDKVTSHERNSQSPVSPPLPDMTGLQSQYYDRRRSAGSQVSDISKDEMDRIREKFDEDALYTQFRDPSPTGSKVSALSVDEDQDLDAIIEEKLGDQGLEEDLEKSQAMQQPLRPSAPRQSSQPISVVRLSRLPQERRVSQSAESVKRHSRFSFESDGNALAEAMLVTGYAKPKLVDSSQEQHMASQVPETLGEEAPDEPPPPFEDPQAPYRPDEKHETVDERPYPGHLPQNNPPISHGEYNPTQYNPPQYQPLRSHSPKSEPPRENRLSQPQIHHAHHSSISSLSNVVTNNSAPRVSMSPEPRSWQSKQPVAFGSNKQMQETKEQENPIPSSRASRWTNGLFGREAQTGPTGNNGLSTGSGNLFGPGRQEEDSFGSGDSMAVQAALSRNDLRAEPSPLHRESETASATSGNSFKVSVPFKNKVKFVGKRARGSSIETPAVEEPAERKAADKSKASDKKMEGKKGAFNKISGIFNRSNPNQRVRQAEAKQRSSLNDLPPKDTQQVHVPWQRFHALHNPPTASASSHIVHQYSSSSYPAYQNLPQQASLPDHGKGLPPPPGGFYAPSPPADALQYQEYPPHPDTVGTYKPTYEQQNPTKTAHTFYAPQERHSGSSHSYSVGSPISGSGSTAWHDASSPPTERGRNRAQDLRLRSRSPVSQPLRPTDRYNQNVNYSDPIYRLGKFHAVTETSRIGDQSTPFPITLPDGIDRGQLSPRNSIQPENLADVEKALNPGLGLRPPGTSIQSVINPSTRDQVSSRSPLALHISQQHQYTPSQNASQIGVDTPENTQHGQVDQYYDDRIVKTKNAVPVELPVPRDDSSEEIVMSSTAYPGQEWQPSGFDNWMPY